MTDQQVDILLSQQKSIADAIINKLSIVFYKNYDFWSIIILGFSLYFLIKYTFETQGMKEEMITQRKMSNAHDVYFDMRTNTYLSAYPYNKQIFGELTTVTASNTISEFLFLDENSKPIGRHTDFLKMKDEDNNIVADYRIENEEDRVSFIKTLCSKNGLIKARIITTNADKFIYTYKAVTENYKIVTKENPNRSDSFRLVGKIII